ncbi:hypothetical protein [Flavobacterium limi]|uniref:Uncharacterized protein n=1 Tax=Flavobacterium limi TaxID=2045105 RepID=A0ABQ1UE11_9FLAO|nr:hypothetical protein [Flavobacterium limi]GGF16582.1 hypothetical protein GCM10011518_27520 [Flavobacterium limi]
MEGQSISDFIPIDWKLLASAKGDLNNDKNDDIAFIIQYKDSVSIEKIEFDEKETVVTQPRILILAFFNPIQKKYEVIEQSNSFILNHDDPNMSEPFQNIEIKKGILRIDFQIFMNAGSWSMSNNSYVFRYQQNEFKLIGADYNYLHRGSGETENRSYNFSTKKVKISTDDNSGSKEKTLLRPFKYDKLKTFKTFIPFTWEIEKDFYL